jgi:DNA-binding transcriptional MocR family regulator
MSTTKQTIASQKELLLSKIQNITSIQYALNTPEGGLGLVKEIPFGECALVYHVRNQSGERLFAVWSNKGNVRMEEFALPQPPYQQDGSYFSSVNDSNLRQRRIEEGVKIITEFLEREG